MENPPLLSIIVPTRNRQKYAISAINSILGIPAKDIELVVYDNSDSDDLRNYIYSNINDDRLRYYYMPHPSSMPDNWNNAVGMASGKYLCLIGDDDGINPEIIEATRWADMKDIDALKPTISVSYLWPGSEVTSVPINGLLTIIPFSGRVIRPDPEVEMKKVVRTGGFKYLGTELPRLYHGIVRRECLNKVRETTGAFFGGLSPDIYAALSISNFTKNVVSIDYPLTIAGTSHPSGSAQLYRREHLSKKLEDTPLFRYKSAYEWAEIVPRLYIAPTIWADSAVAALKALKRDDILQDFNLPLLAAYCIVAYPKNAHIVLRDMYTYFRATNKNKLMGTFRFCYSLLIGPCGLIKPVTRRVIRHILLVERANIRINEVENIVEATNVLTDYLRKRKMRFSDFVS